MIVQWVEGLKYGLSWKQSLTQLHGRESSQLNKIKYGFALVKHEFQSQVLKGKQGFDGRKSNWNTLSTHLADRCKLSET